jgi:hypothetical protein
MLTSATDLPVPKQPIFAVHTLNDMPMLQANSQDFLSVNEMTESMIQGR